jgi:hypothetical protein
MPPFHASAPAEGQIGFRDDDQYDVGSVWTSHGIADTPVHAASRRSGMPKSGFVQLIQTNGLLEVTVV